MNGAHSQVDLVDWFGVTSNYVEIALYPCRPTMTMLDFIYITHVNHCALCVIILDHGYSCSTSSIPYRYGFFSSLVSIDTVKWQT